MGKVKYQNKTIAYTINKAKIKNIYITIENGEVVIKAPWYTTRNQIQEVVESKRDWIMKKLEEYNVSPRKAKEYEDGEKFQILGESYYLNIYYKDINNAILNVENEKIEIILPLSYAEEDNTEQIKKMIDKMYYMIAEKEVESAMEKTRKMVGLAPEEYKIKKIKYAWGTCSSRKVITINQNLMMYSRKAIEYVVLHEICHLKYMNHSKKFWEMVESYMPDYKEAEKELKK
ncbi:zinc metalloprotease [Clostridium sp. CAG:793]|jgi:predicted metal-dependent hydrolase|nr:zinc metalloprotease [Clostridium sp. CAG:793]